MSPDVNTEVASSNASDVKEQESSTAEQDVKQESKTDDQKIVEAIGATGEESSEQATGEEKVEGQENTQQVVEQEEKGQEQEVKHEEAIPYERFKETLDKATNYETRVKELEPQAERIKALDTFCQQNGIQNQEFEQLLTYARLRRQNPEQAYQLIKAEYEQLAQLAGDRLPEDLQSRVAAGTLDPEIAKETAKLRMAQRHQQWNQQGVQQQQAQLQQQSLAGAVDQWDFALRKRDTAFHPKAPNAVDGKYEFVTMKLAQLLRSKPPQTMEQAVKLADQAYAEVNSFYASVLPKPGVRKAPLRSTNAASQNATGVIKNEKDVLHAIMGNLRPHQIKYS